MTTKTANPTVPAPTSHAMVESAVRSMDCVYVQGRTIVVEYDACNVWLRVSADRQGCLDLDQAIRSGGVAPGEVFAEVGISCGNTGWHDIDIATGDPATLSAAIEAIPHLYADSARTDVRSALRAIYRRIA